MAETRPTIAIIDSTPEAAAWRQVLAVEGYQIAEIAGPAESLPEALRASNSALGIINLAVVQETSDWQIFLRRHREFPFPLILLAPHEISPEQAHAFYPEAAALLYLPFETPELLKAVEQALETKTEQTPSPADQTTAPTAALGLTEGEAFDRLLDDQFGSFLKFRDYLVEQVTRAGKSLPSDSIKQVSPQRLYDLAAGLGLSQRQLAQQLADFLGFPYTQLIDRYEVKAGIITPSFSHSHFVVPIGGEEETPSFVVSNPFDFELLDVVKNLTHPAKPELIITDPKTVEELLDNEGPGEVEAETATTIAADGATRFEGEEGIGEHPVIFITDRILQAAVTEGASDVHIEPKENTTTVRFRIDGDLSEKFTLKKKTGMMLISRLKALAGMDIAEHRKPQDGAAEIRVGERHFVLRLATTSTVHGESLVFRMLDRSAKVLSLEELGMTPRQAASMQHFANSPAGLVMVVGPTGSGKTTTLYTLFSLIDCRTRSLISVEDPVEYRIPFANQQQVNEKAGINFQSLLKSAVRQDPDILFIGEIRDDYSATTAIEFTSIGHLTLTTLHTSSATSAIFRLEELGVTRTQMADTLLGIISQRLIKRLCESCKEARPLSEEEQRVVGLVSEIVPQTAYFPVGCPACNFSGYHGREGIYEVIPIDASLSEAIRRGLPIIELRRMVKERGELLMSQQAVEKLRQGVFALRDIYQHILMEAELHLRSEAAKSEVTLAPAPASPSRPAQEAAPLVTGPEAGKPRLLIVDDDTVTRKILTRYAETAEYEVVASADGIDALLQIGAQQFDLIVSDLNMPNLNGFSLLEMLRQKGIETPIIFITASDAEEDNKHALSLGAADIVHKPIDREVFLSRVTRSLQAREPA